MSFTAGSWILNPRSKRRRRRSRRTTFTIDCDRAFFQSGSRDFISNATQKGQTTDQEHWNLVKNSNHDWGRFHDLLRATTCTHRSTSGTVAPLYIRFSFFPSRLVRFLCFRLKAIGKSSVRLFGFSPNTIDLFQLPSLLKSYTTSEFTLVVRRTAPHSHQTPSSAACLQASALRCAAH